MEARKSPYDEIVFVGLTYYANTLTQRVTMEQVNETYSQAIKHGTPFGLSGWSYISKELNGCLPIHMSANLEDNKHLLSWEVLDYLRKLGK